MERKEHISDDTNEANKNHTYSVEVPLEKDLIGKLIKAIRKIRNYSQSKLGTLLGVQKAQISKLEKNDRNLTLFSMIKIFKALKAQISFKIELDKKKDLAVIQEVLQEGQKENGAIKISKVFHENENGSGNGAVKLNQAAGS